MTPPKAFGAVGACGVTFRFGPHLFRLLSEGPQKIVISGNLFLFYGYLHIYTFLRNTKQILCGGLPRVVA
jgi:hypothetical protein